MDDRLTVPETERCAPWRYYAARIRGELRDLAAAIRAADAVEMPGAAAALRGEFAELWTLRHTPAEAFDLLRQRAQK